MTREVLCIKARVKTNPHSNLPPNFLIPISQYPMTLVPSSQVAQAPRPPPVGLALKNHLARSNNRKELSKTADTHGEQAALG